MPSLQHSLLYPPKLQATWWPWLVANFLIGTANSLLVPEVSCHVSVFDICTCAVVVLITIYGGENWEWVAQSQSWLRQSWKDMELSHENIAVALLHAPPKVRSTSIIIHQTLAIDEGHKQQYHNLPILLKLYQHNNQRTDARAEVAQ